MGIDAKNVGREVDGMESQANIMKDYKFNTATFYPVELGFDCVSLII